MCLLKECKCSDIDLCPFFSSYHDYGRAYLRGGCNTCNSEYITLTHDNRPIPEKYRNDVTDIVLPKGFKIEISSGTKISHFSAPGIEVSISING